MIELIQFPWSPFCIVQRRILEFAGVRFKLTNIPSTDRSLVWKLTRERYYQFCWRWQARRPSPFIV